MPILKDLLETAAGATTAGATAASSVAGYRAPLFSKKKKKKDKKHIIRRGPPVSTYGFKFVGEHFTLTDFLSEKVGGDDIDTSDVIAKLKAAEKSAEYENDDTTAFALEDENGKMVKVWVPSEQADDFQSALEMALSKNDEDENEENSALEIAEVLWKMRKDFDIINVEWGEIPEDQEEVVPSDVEVEGEGDDVEGGAEEAVGPQGEEAPEGEGKSEGGEEGEMVPGGEEVPGEMGGNEEAASALQQVIDAMKADAEARKADAEAKKAEAEAEAAKYAAQAAEAKVKQEEEILDMEDYYNQKKEEDNEAKRLAQLAKFKHDLAKDQGASLSSETSKPAPEELPPPPAKEEQEEVSRGHYVPPRDQLSDMIQHALRRGR